MAMPILSATSGPARMADGAPVRPSRAGLTHCYLSRFPAGGYPQNVGETILLPRGFPMNVEFPRPSSSSPLHALQPAIRFRLLDSDTWLEGQVEDFSEEGLAFLTDLPLEIGTYLEIALPEA